MPPNAGHAYPAQVQRGGETVLAWLAAHHPQATPATWAARIARGEVTVDGHPAEPDAPLRAGQTVTWHRPPWEEPPAPLHYSLIHDDGALLAVDKPGGLPTLPGGDFQEHTLLALVRRDHPGASPLHRLGRGTSGLVLFARTPDARAQLTSAWGRVRKVYRALASGTPPWDELDIRAPIGPVAHARLGTVHAASAAGRAAHSRARVLKRRADGTLLDVELLSGRPHQIRIHLAWAGHGLVGDPLYGAGGQPRPDGLPGDLGYLLHAHRLEVPWKGRTLVLEAPPPPELQGSDPGR